jgi:serpin B
LKLITSTDFKVFAGYLYMVVFLIVMKEKIKLIRRIAMLLLILSMLVSSGCGPGVIMPIADDSQATDEAVIGVVDNNNHFALELYSELKDEGDNVFFSPYSIAAALAMAYEGADSQTAEEMADVLNLPEDSMTRRSSYARIHNLINKKDKEYQLYSANAFWAHEGYSFLPDYTDTIERYYAAEANNLDFRNAEQSRQTINKWVEEHTNGKIEDLIPAGALNALTRLVLTNAVYFKGDWVLKFDKKKTRDNPFRITPDNEVTVKMMGLTGNKAKFNYAFIPEEELQIIELPYEGEDLSMIILLPKEGGMDELEGKLSVDNLNAWKSMMHETKIDVYMPKFEFETKYFLPQALSAMGTPTAFQWPGADFSKMDGTQNLFISNVIHQAYIKVDEEGTEAAAATAIIMELGDMIPTEFRADHPFIFMIQEKTAGGILFMGKVVDPR